LHDIVNALQRQHTSVLSLKSGEQIMVLSHLMYKGDDDAKRTANS
jgi:hypothetical protein